MKLKLVTFDVTGTVLKLRESVGHQYSKVGSSHGLNVSPDILSKNFYSVFKEMLVEHPNFGESSIGWPEWWRQLVFHVFTNSLSDNTSLPPSTINKISSELIEVYRTKECWKLAEGAQSLFDKLRRINIHLGVISNYDPRLEDILKDLNVRNYFNFILTSYNAKCQKPNPAIFQAVEDMHVNLKKEEIMHIGDNPELDFIGARNKGWNALLVAEDSTKVTERFPDIEKEWIVKDIGEVYQTLEDKHLL